MKCDDELQTHYLYGFPITSITIAYTLNIYKLSDQTLSCHWDIRMIRHIGRHFVAPSGVRQLYSAMYFLRYLSRQIHQ